MIWVIGMMFTCGVVILDDELKTLSFWDQIILVLAVLLTWPVILGMATKGMFKGEQE